MTYSTGFAKALARAAAMSACALGLAATASAEPRDLGALSWMVGCWQSKDGANVEVWSPPVGGVMFGHATTSKDGALTFFEQARIDMRRDRFGYSVSPQGDRWVTFVSPPAPPPELDRKGRPLPGPPVATFENGANGYPQRIQYRSTGKRSLAATISNLDGSRAVEYAWEKCRN